MLANLQPGTERQSYSGYKWKEDDRRKNLVKASLEMLAFRYVVKEKPYDNYSYR